MHSCHWPTGTKWIGDARLRRKSPRSLRTPQSHISHYARKDGIPHALSEVTFPVVPVHPKSDSRLSFHCMQRAQRALVRLSYWHNSSLLLVTETGQRLPWNPKTPFPMMARFYPHLSRCGRRNAAEDDYNHEALRSFSCRLKRG